MEAVVLAGGRTDRLPVPCKADLIIGDRPMLEYVVGALQAVPRLTKISIAREDDADLVNNLLRAVERLELEADDYVLISSCDIPFLTSEAIQDFLEQCTTGYDFYYPIVKRESCESRFPGVKRTYAKLREGTFTGGNLFLVRVAVLPTLTEVLQRIFAKRKSPFKLAGEFGWGLTVRFLISTLFGTLSIAELERNAERLAGIRPKAVISHFAEIGTDIDKVADLELIERFL